MQYLFLINQQFNNNFPHQLQVHTKCHPHRNKHNVRFMGFIQSTSYYALGFACGGVVVIPLLGLDNFSPQPIFQQLDCLDYGLSYVHQTL